MEASTIQRYVRNHERQLIEGLSRLVSIDSTLGEPGPGAPFGPGPAAALEEALRLSADWGLPGENLEGYVGVVDLNHRETALHILGHLDVVPAGEGWTVTEPFTPLLRNGMLYGRGSSDDKGPMAAALLAMQTIKELGVPLKRNVRLILGTDEETGFRDIQWYFARHPHAPFTLSPDADFPIINIEKGHYQPTFSASWSPETVLPRVTSFTGGPRLNMVPPKARAFVLGLGSDEIRQAAGHLSLEPEITFQLTEEDGGVSILCSGQNAHGSTPEEGHNAQTALLSLLSSLPLADCSSTRAIRSMAEMFPHGDHTGQSLGIAQADELSGALSLAFTMLSLSDVGFEARFDSRTPLCGTEESIRDVTRRAMERACFSLTGEIDPPHHVPADSPFIKTLSRAYEAYTGQPGHCLAIGGGTYVHGIPGGVAFGANMPGFVCNLHGPDERVRVEDLLITAMIYAQVIVDLCA